MERRFRLALRPGGSQRPSGRIGNRFPRTKADGLESKTRAAFGNTMIESWQTICSGQFRCQGGRHAHDRTQFGRTHQWLRRWKDHWPGKNFRWSFTRFFISWPFNAKSNVIETVRFGLIQIDFSQRPGSGWAVLPGNAEFRASGLIGRRVRRRLPHQRRPQHLEGRLRHGGAERSPGFLPERRPDAARLRSVARSQRGQMQPPTRRGTLFRLSRRRLPRFRLPVRFLRGIRKG